MDLYQNELVYEIRNKAFLEGEAMPDDVSGRLRSLVQDVGDDGNIDVVNRALEKACSDVREMLFPYTKERVRPLTYGNNEEGCGAVYVIDMMVPETMSQTTLDHIKNCVHDYMVSRALEEWLTLTYPSAASKYAVRAEEMKEKICEEANYRVKRVRRTQTCF